MRERPANVSKEESEYFEICKKILSIWRKETVATIEERKALESRRDELIDLMSNEEV